MRDETPEEQARKAAIRARVVDAIKREERRDGTPESERMPDYQVEFLADIEMVDHARYPRLHLSR